MASISLPRGKAHRQRPEALQCLWPCALESAMLANDASAGEPSPSRTHRASNGLTEWAIAQSSLSILFGLLYFVQGVVEPTEGLLSVADQIAAHRPAHSERRQKPRVREPMAGTTAALGRR